jgi:hypothetical protein
MSTLAVSFFTEEQYDSNLLVVLGGEKTEAIIATKSHDPKVLGVTTDLNNCEITLAEFGNNATFPLVAVAGRVDCQVQGPIEEGDCVVTSDQPGIGQKLDPTKWVPGCIVGKAVNAIPDDSVQTINIVVGLH